MNWNEVVAALVIGVPSLILGLLAYQRSRKGDAASELSGIASNHRAGTTQVIEGYQGLLTAMQQGVAAAEKRCEDRIADAVDELKEQINERPTKQELLEVNGILLDANGKLRTQLLNLGETPVNGT